MAEERNLWQEDQTSKELRFYFQTAKRPLEVGFGVILFFYLLSLISFLSWSQASLNYLSWLAAVVLLLVVCFKVAKVKFKEISQAATAGVLVGLAVGFWHVILEAIWFRSWWSIVDFIVEPLVLALIGLFLGLVISEIWQIKNNKIKVEIKKEPAAAPTALEDSELISQDQDEE